MLLSLGEVCKPARSRPAGKDKIGRMKDKFKNSLRLMLSWLFLSCLRSAKSYARGKTYKTHPLSFCLHPLQRAGSSPWLASLSHCAGVRLHFVQALYRTSSLSPLRSSLHAGFIALSHFVRAFTRALSLRAHAFTCSGSLSHSYT